jgi:16S rRNA G966 N2-methylase RsmD
VQRWLAQAASLGDPYDLILADPPYALDGKDALLLELAQSPLLSGDTLLLVEHSSRSAPAPMFGRLTQVKTRAHGDSAFTVYAAGEGSRRASDVATCVSGVGQGLAPCRAAPD